MTEKWLTNIVGNQTDCTPGMCGACCVWPQIENTEFFKPAYTRCPEFDPISLLCNEWPEPPCGHKNWTCRENVNRYSDAHVFRGELIAQMRKNIQTKYALIKQRAKHLMSRRLAQIGQTAAGEGCFESPAD